MSKRKILWSILGVVALAALGIQLIPYGRNHLNPPVLTAPQWDSRRTQELFARACADCHSNETVWPWYSNLAPMSWLVQYDVDEGRREFNISTGAGEADEAAEKLSEDKMPLRPYLLLHSEANLPAAEKQELIQGLLTTFGREEGKDDASRKAND